MGLNNKTLIHEIDYWNSEFPHLEGFFKLKEIEGFLVIADVIPDKDKFQNLIVRYVSGLIDLYLYIQTKNNDYFDEFDLKTKDIFKIITKILKSENYQDNLINKSIPASRTHLIDGVNLVIKDEIKCYIQRIQAVPLTTKDLDSIELNLIEFSRNKYHKQKAPKDDVFNESIVTIIDGEKWDTEEIYKQFNDVLFKCDKDVFNDWFVTGKGNSETPKIIKGVALRQVFFLLQQIVINPNETKETYFDTVFNKKYSKGLIKSKDYVSDFKDKFKPKLALCRIIAKKQP